VSAAGPLSSRPAATCASLYTCIIALLQWCLCLMFGECVLPCVSIPYCWQCTHIVSSSHSTRCMSHAVARARRTCCRCIGWLEWLVCVCVWVACRSIVRLLLCEPVDMYIYTDTDLQTHTQRDTQTHARIVVDALCSWRAPVRTCIIHAVYRQHMGFTWIHYACRSQWSASLWIYITVIVYV